MQQRHKHFVERHTKHSWLIRRFAGVGAVVNRIFAHGDALNGKHRESFLLVVVTGMIAKRPFERGFVRVQNTFEYDFGIRGDGQIITDTFRQNRTAVAQQSGELILAQCVRHRCDRTEYGRRVTAEHNADRERRIRMRETMIAKIERATAMREPAHDEFIAPEYLLAINTEVLPSFMRPFGHDQAPRQQRRDVTRPAVLDRQLCQIDVVTFEDDFMHRRVFFHFRTHVPNRFGHFTQLADFFQPCGRLRLFQIRQQLTNRAQLAHILRTHAECNTTRRAE